MEKTATNGADQKPGHDMIQGLELAVASEDYSLRVFSLKALLLASEKVPEKTLMVS